MGNVAKLSKPKLDILSVALIGISLVGILYAISTVFTNWWIALITFVVGIALLFVFVLRQKKLDEPLINLSPLKVKPFSIGVIINMIALILVFALNILVPKFLISVSNANPLEASLALFPAIMLSCLVAQIAGKIYDKFGAKLLLPIGFVCMAVFIVILSFLITSPSIVLIALLYIPIIVGSALIIGPVQSYALSFLTYEQNPHGVTILSTGFQIAGCIGASLFASIYAQSLNNLGFEKAGTAFLIVGIILAVVAVIGLLLSLLLNYLKKKTTQTTIETKQEVEPTLRSLMKREIYSINNKSTISDAMALFVNKKISGCPIVDENNKLVGFISDGDIIRYLSANHTDFKNMYTFSVTDGQDFTSKLNEMLTKNVAEVAGKDFFYVDINESLGEVCRVLAETHKKKAPVLENGEMVGIVTRSDITKFAMNYSLNLTKHDNKN